MTHKQIMEEVPMLETSLAAQWRVAELARNERAVELQRIKANVDKMILRAPISGLVVMQTTMRAGEMSQIKAGDQVGAGLASHANRGYEFDDVGRLREPGERGAHSDWGQSPRAFRRLPGSGVARGSVLHWSHAQGRRVARRICQGGSGHASGC